MTEQQMEQLEKMFPKGFIIVNVSANSNVHIYKHNPENHYMLNAVGNISFALFESFQEEEEPDET
jgi:hypothetical protein